MERGLRVSEGMLGARSVGIGVGVSAFGGFGDGGDGVTWQEGTALGKM